jgi:two-component system, cell cycle response regulator DivK
MDKPKVLIVEDNVDNFQLVQFLLERKGYAVVSAATGREGVEAAKREHPDLILMDLSMPEMDGWEATRQIKSAAETSHIPILALTAHTLPGDHKRAMDAGCDAYISKPIRVASFDKQVATWLQQARTDSQT